mmetsp:Transcript_13565/g.23084  ORF Transcript_13565/g.23084 Transcript_13565/m.23084 type:complete len:107 (+) Transcript_13565:2-322(+)
MSQKEALKFACQVAFLTVSKMGAGPSMPTMDELEAVFGPENIGEGSAAPVTKPKPLEDHHYFALIRHGERKDRSDEKDEPFPNKYDPPLSRQGMKEARQAGVYLMD